MSDPETTEFVFRAVEEASPGDAWRSLFTGLWPDYRRWYLSRGDATRPSYLACESALRRFMPELVPIWERLVELVGGGDLEARFLSLYCPPPYLSSCSQAACRRERAFLVRNYDFSPKLFEGVFLKSRWSARSVIASTDGLVGVLDGINDAGLAVSLAFGGKEGTGVGFGAPIVLRYLLEVCETTADAERALMRVPFHMAYNVLVLDRHGDHVTAFVGPDATPRLTRSAISTNHQERIVWPRHAAATATLARESRLASLVENPGIDRARLVDAFLEPPLYNTSYSRGFGTLYTAVYDPARLAVEYLWPGEGWKLSMDDFASGTRAISFVDRPAREER